MPAPQVLQLDSLPPVGCPCGTARRALADYDGFPGTVHLTEISIDARRHYHRHHTEVYIFLECDEDAQMELDDETISVQPLTTIVIPPGVRHRAIGKMKVIILCQPNFDPQDEFFD